MALVAAAPSSSGNSIVIRVPRLLRMGLLAVIVPPIAFTKPAEIVRPRPVPTVRPSLPPTRWNFSNMGRACLGKCRRQHDHGQVATAPDLGEDILAVHVRQAEVEQDQLRSIIECPPEGRSRGRRRDDLIAAGH